MTTSLGGLLSELDRLWRGQGAAIADNALPGLTDDEIDALIDPLGLVLPEELRVWWRWHDGVRGSLAAFASDYDEASVGPGAWQLISLAEAVDRYRSEPRKAQYVGDPIAGEFYWRDSWFPFVQAGSNDVLFMDTTQISGGRCPIRIRYSWNWEYWDVDQAPSLADAVQVWIRTLTDRYYVWNPETREWDHDRLKMPPDLRTNLIA